MLKVFWGLTPPPPKKEKMLKTGEMLKMLKFPEMFPKKVLKTGEM